MEENPAPVDMVNITLFAGFLTSQVVSSPDFWTINNIKVALSSQVKVVNLPYSLLFATEKSFKYQH